MVECAGGEIQCREEFAGRDQLIGPCDPEIGDCRGCDGARPKGLLDNIVQRHGGVGPKRDRVGSPHRGVQREDGCLTAGLSGQSGGSRWRRGDLGVRGFRLPQSLRSTGKHG